LQSLLAPRTADTMEVRRIAFQGCADGYASVVSPMFGLSPITSEHGFAQNTAIAWHTDLCFFGIGESNPFARTRGARETQDSGHLIEVTRYLSGTEQGVSGDCIIDRAPGPIYVLDQAHSIESLNSQFQVEQVFVPKAILGLPADWLAKERIIGRATHEGQLLHACLSEIYGALGGGTAQIESAMLQRFFALLKINLGVPAERGDVRVHFRKAQRAQICRFIDRNLGNPKLSTSTLLASFGVSRATLYRMFEGQGGVRHYIMHRRAVRAVLDISKNWPASGVIKKASERWGFSSRPNFNRAVRSLFGTCPSHLYAEPRPSVAAKPALSNVLKQFSDQTARAA